MLCGLLIFFYKCPTRTYALAQDMRLLSPHVREGSLVFWIPRHEFQIPGTGFHILCQWNLDSGFLELFSGFKSPGFRIPESKLDSWIPLSTSKTFPDPDYTSKDLPDSGIGSLLHGASFSHRCIFILYPFFFRGSLTYRGYYMPARGYEFYLRVFNSISHSFAARTL